MCYADLFGSVRESRSPFALTVELEGGWIPISELVVDKVGTKSYKVVPQDKDGKRPLDRQDSNSAASSSASGGDEWVVVPRKRLLFVDVSLRDGSKVITLRCVQFVHFTTQALMLQIAAGAAQQHCGSA